MKKVVSLLIAVLLMVCAVVSVSAEISPSASTVVDKTITIDAIAVPDNAGTVTPGVDSPVEYVVGTDGTVKLVASSMEGFKFTHWTFVTGEFDIIEGSLTSSTIVILPKGDNNIRAYANFVEEGEDVTVPESKPVEQPDDDNKSPTTGEPVAVYTVMGAVVLMLGVAVVAFKKKAC